MSSHQNNDRPKTDQRNGRALEYLPYPGPYYLPDLHEVHGSQLPDFLEDDVIPAVAAKYRVSSGGKNSALWVLPCPGLLRSILPSSDRIFLTA